MDGYTLWGLSAAVLGVALLASLFMWRNRASRGFQSDDLLQTVGIALVALGIVFGDDRLIGYSFIGVGVLLSMASLVVRKRAAMA